jgi:RimJ/RimL family protein N-acetyltransferase
MYKHKNGIILKKIEFSDLEILKDLKNESWFGTHNIKFVNSIDQEVWFNSLDSNKNLILIAINSVTDEKIGLYKVQNIDWVNRKYDSGYDVFENYRGRGYSKLILEAGVDFGFEILNMNRIDTEVLENNLASMKSILWVGFVKEGIRRKSIYKCNEYLDSIFLGLLRNDWILLERLKKYSGICNLSYIPKNKKNE